MQAVGSAMPKNSDQADGRILVTGTSGFVGSGIVARLSREGRPVIAVARATHHAPAGVVSLGLGDIGSVDWRPVLSGCSTIVHCAARAHVVREDATDPLATFRSVNRDAAFRLARAAAAAGVRRFIFLSSIGVNGNVTDDRAFGWDDVPRPHSAYAIAKWEAERGLAAIAAETGLELVVIRPPLVIGPDPKGNLGRLVSAMRRGLPLPLGAVTQNRRDLVSIETLSDLIVHALEHPEAMWRPLLVSDGRPMSTRGVIESLARIHGLAPRLVPVPPVALRAALRMAGKRELGEQLLGDLQVDIGDTCRRLSWSPPQGATA